jgi:hypothetical protein
MEHSWRKLYQGQPGTSATTLYTVPGATAAIIKHIRVTNPTGTDRTIKLWHDGTANANVILPAATVLAGGWAEFDGNILMEAADTMSGQASAATALTVTIYGDEVTL